MFKKNLTAEFNLQKLGIVKEAIMFTILIFGIGMKKIKLLQQSLQKAVKDYANLQP